MTTRQPRGSGSVRQRADGRWEIRVAVGTRPDGKTHYRSIYCKTEHEARARLADIQRQVDVAGRQLDPGMTLADFLRDWLEHAAKPSVRPRTYIGYRQIVTGHIIPQLGKIPLGTLKPHDCQRFYSARVAAGLSARTVLHFHAVLRRALQQAVHWELLTRNPADLADRPRAERYQAETLTADEARRFLAAAKDHHLYALFVLAITTGARQGELLALRWQDIDLKSGRVTIARALTKDAEGKVTTGRPKTRSSERTIPIGRVAAEALETHRERQPAPVELVFPGATGDFLSASNLGRKVMPKLLKAAGVSKHVRFHDLRHSAATLLMELGESPKTVAALLGHASIAITLDTYTHASDAVTAVAVGRLTDLISPPDGSANGSLTH